MCDIILHKLYFVLVGRAYVLNYSVGIFVGGDGLSRCCGQFPMQHIQSCVTASIQYKRICYHTASALSSLLAKGCHSLTQTVPPTFCVRSIFVRQQ